MEWVKDGCPRNSDGSFFVVDVCEWRTRTKTNNTSDVAELRRQILEQELERAREDVATRRLKRRKLEGELLPADDVSQWVATEFVRVKNRLEMIPDEILRLLPREHRHTVHHDLEHYVYQLLLEMADWSHAGPPGGTHATAADDDQTDSDEVG